MHSDKFAIFEHFLNAPTVHELPVNHFSLSQIIYSVQVIKQIVRKCV